MRVYIFDLAQLAQTADILIGIKLSISGEIIYIQPHELLTFYSMDIILDQKPLGHFVQIFGSKLKRKMMKENIFTQNYTRKLLLSPQTKC